MSDFIDIAPGCFADKELLVINYNGQAYYRACGAPVSDLVGGSGLTTCVKRVNHPPHTGHEDYFGVTREV